MGADDQRLAVRGERHRPDARLLRSRAFLLRLGADVPKLHRSIEAAAREPAAIGREHRRGHPILVSLERRRLLRVARRPELDRAVGAAAGDLRAIGRIGDDPDGVAVPFELALFVTVGVPEFDEFVAAAGRERAAIGGEFEGGRGPGVRRDRLRLAAIGRVPDDHGAILASRRQFRAVRGEVERPHPALVLLEIAPERACGIVPELHQSVIAGGGRELAVLRDAHRPDGRGMSGHVADTRAIGLPDDHVARPVEQALATGGRKCRAIGGILGRDHPSFEVPDRCRRMFRGFGGRLCRWCGGVGGQRPSGRTHEQNRGDPKPCQSHCRALSVRTVAGRLFRPHGR